MKEREEQQPQNEYDIENALNLSPEEILETHPEEAIKILAERCETDNPSEINELSNRYNHTMKLYNMLSEIYGESDINPEE